MKDGTSAKDNNLKMFNIPQHIYWDLSHRYIYCAGISLCSISRVLTHLVQFFLSKKETNVKDQQVLLGEWTKLHPQSTPSVNTYTQRQHKVSRSTWAHVYNAQMAKTTILPIGHKACQSREFLQQSFSLSLLVRPAARQGNTDCLCSNLPDSNISS